MTIVALAERFNLLGQTAFMTGGFVLMNDAAGCHAVEHRNGFTVGRLRRCLVTLRDGCGDLLELAAHHRTTGLIVAAPLLSLPGAFLSGGDIGQRVAPVNSLARRKER